MVCVQPQQPQAPAPTPTRTSSIDSWAEIPPTQPARIVNAEPVSRHDHQAQYHQREQMGEVEEVAVLEQAPATQHIRAEVPIVKPRAIKARTLALNKLLPHGPSNITAYPRSQARAQARPLGSKLSIHPSARVLQAPLAYSHRRGPLRSVVWLVEVIKKSHYVRRAAELHVDVGNADLSSPTSHEARVQANAEEGLRLTPGTSC
ncbi:hypothetical protein FRB90_005058 [Tulasnella sp. 427]|nr:hypothetical protein FRB90_005058 [Tulasnella sp. 427]